MSLFSALEQLLPSFEASLTSASTLAAVEEAQTAVLGRKGALAQIMNRLPELAPAERPALGKAANEVKARLTALAEARLTALAAQAEAQFITGFDPSLPGRAPWQGSLHPATQVMEEICTLFEQLGFETISGPEVETDFHNFEALNLPKDHPARDMQDTFYVAEGVVLRTHTSPMQVRAMLERKAPPLACLLGISLSEEFCEQTLGSLGCTVEITPAGQSKTWQVTPPSHRLDLTREADLIEELVRIYGVDNVPPVLPSITRPLDRAGLPESEYTFRSRVKHWGKGLGLNEIIAYSFVSHKELQHLGLSQDYAGQVRLQNPLSDDLNTLRTALAPSLLLALRTNLAQGTTGVRLFEVASTYTADPNSPTTAKESPCLGILLCGDRFDAHWPQAQAELDYHDLKGIVTHCLHTFGLSQPRYVLEQGLPFLAPCIGVYADNTRLGWLGKVSPALADPFHAKKPVWMAEIDLTALYTASHAAVRRFTPLAVFPPVRRDITIIASPGIQASAILAAVDDLGLEGLEEAKLIDLFAPEHSEERNLTFRLTFRHASRTLKDAEVDNLRDKVAQTLPKVLAVRI
ncbi:hypothetical protein B566_EDAN018747 [Ephemera danica]|nr:hypothetical protein B566_EDAN018747 [Ephemera danica]